MSLVLYDTYTRSLREFKPLSGNDVGVYACGPTVYDFPHIGNMRTYIFGDILRRVLVFNGYFNFFWEALLACVPFGPF